MLTQLKREESTGRKIVTITFTVEAANLRPTEVVKLEKPRDQVTPNSFFDPMHRSGNIPRTSAI
jgi:hypothetical protein